MVQRLNNILVATDFSPVSENAIDYATLLAARNDAHLHIVHVRVLFEDFYEREMFPERERYQDVLDRAAKSSFADLPDEFDVPVTKKILRGVSAPVEIVEYATENDVDLIVLGTRGRTGLAHMFLGSVAQMVVRLSPASVLVVGQGARQAPGKAALQQILCPLDFSDMSKHAFRAALALAERHHAQVRAVHVVEEVPHPAFYQTGKQSVLEVFPQIEKRSREEITKLIPAGYERPVDIIIAEGRPHRKIVELAREHAVDLIVMGSTGLSRLQKLLLGSVAEKVLRTSPSPVLIIKDRGQAATA